MEEKAIRMLVLASKFQETFTGFPRSGTELGPHREWCMLRPSPIFQAHIHPQIPERIVFSAVGRLPGFSNNIMSCESWKELPQTESRETLEISTLNYPQAEPLHDRQPTIDPSFIFCGAFPVPRSLVAPTFKMQVLGKTRSAVRYYTNPKS